jgi:hypothetical protein
MSDRYPSLSPYAYCAWNPVKMVDPDGNKIKISGNITYVPNFNGMQSNATYNLLDRAHPLRGCAQVSGI